MKRGSSSPWPSRCRSRPLRRPRAEQTVTYKSGDETASRASSSRRKARGRFPAVIVIQEWWGLNDWVKDQARALAKEGYVALAVDLYRGKVADKQEDAHQLMMGAAPTIARCAI